MFKSFLPKIVQIPATAVPVALLSTVGYNPPIGGIEQPQPVAAQVYIMMVTLTVCIMSLISFFIKRRYPLRTERHLQDIKAGLEKHRQSKFYPDPVSKIPYRPVQVNPELQNMYWLLDHFRQRRLRKEFIDAHNLKFLPRFKRVQGWYIVVEEREQ